MFKAILLKKCLRVFTKRIMRKHSTQKLIVIVLSYLFCGCVSTPSQKRITTTLASVVFGSLTGRVVAERTDSNLESTMLAYGLVAGGVGVLAAEYLFSEEDLITKLRNENKLLRRTVSSFNGDEKMLRGLDLALIPKATASLSLGHSGPIKCNKPSVRLCPAFGGKTFGKCDDPPFVLINRNWALEFRAWYSESGCFDSGEYTDVPGLKQFLNKSLMRTYESMQLEKEMK